jgi:DNA transformation protein
MFGGGGIYYNDIFFALLDDDRVFFKVDAETVGEYEARGCGPWVCAGEVSPNYRELPAEIWNDPERLGDWIEAAALAAKRLKSKRRA